MRLRKTFQIASTRGFASKNGAGFTLIEILVGIGIFLLILGIIMVFSFSDYQRYIFRKDRDVAIATLMKARSRAMNNLGQSPHGVHIDQDNYTLFRGTVFNSSDPTNDVIPASRAVTKSWFPSSLPSYDIVFAQLSGNDVFGDQSFTLSNGLSNVTISINNEGRIDW